MGGVRFSLVEYPAFYFFQLRLGGSREFRNAPVSCVVKDVGYPPAVRFVVLVSRCF